MLSKKSTFVEHQLNLNSRTPLNSPKLEKTYKVYITLGDPLPEIKTGFDEGFDSIPDYDEYNYCLYYSPASRLRFKKTVERMEDVECFSVKIETKKTPAVKFGGWVECVQNDKRDVFLHRGGQLIRAEGVEILSGSNNTKTYRMWRGISEFDLELFNSGAYREMARRQAEIGVLTEFLHSDVSDEELRLEQSYFLTSVSTQNCIEQLCEAGFNNWEKLSDVLEISYNAETILAIPELIRILIDEKSCSWGLAYDVACRTCKYKMSGQYRFPTWDISVFEALLPRVYQILHEIHKRFINELDCTPELHEKEVWIRLSAPLYDGKVRTEQLQYLMTPSETGDNLSEKAL